MALPTPEEIQGSMSAPDQAPAPEVGVPSPEYAAPKALEAVPAEPEASAPVSEPLQSVSASDEIPEEVVGQLQHFVDVAFSDGPDAAAEEVRKTGNPALIDAVHATLSELHNELEARGKMKPAA
jgi:hypothetical protein